MTQALYAHMNNKIKKFLLQNIGEEDLESSCIIKLNIGGDISFIKRK
jgi:hypothetical protein